MFFNSGRKYIASNDVWRVEINENKINWLSPAFEAETESFTYKITDLAFTETRQEHKGNRNTFWYYELVLKSGARHELPQHTGINLRKIFKVLELFNVDNRFERISTK